VKAELLFKTSKWVLACSLAILVDNKIMAERFFVLAWGVFGFSENKTLYNII